MRFDFDSDASLHTFPNVDWIINIKFHPGVTVGTCANDVDAANNGDLMFLKNRSILSFLYDPHTGSLILTSTGTNQRPWLSSKID
ncbi:uncharacterized protein ASCRUDRAFT_74290 [Ascoidea rubescens DSM 1968]|uniref:Uncharacterized protein n=1 Tax=Ascoidea rubescens DSM 1968 TaxID=1344418 RepID=A0A1D2VMI3_9ASCO|nr:hypothetical protein ASCRUDRAFT_74290 [Ascoidea rubescens DSM 1968]ODV62828.1 hypothetical protein ASCRUDRAFT_74290 [Ascoidea rubescens DSM 1968]